MANTEQVAVRSVYELNSMNFIFVLLCVLLRSWWGKDVSNEVIYHSNETKKGNGNNSESIINTYIGTKTKLFCRKRTIVNRFIFNGHWASSTIRSVLYLVGLVSTHASTHIYNSQEYSAHHRKLLIVSPTQTQLHGQMCLMNAHICISRSCVTSMRTFCPIRFSSRRNEFRLYVRLRLGRCMYGYICQRW